MRTLNAALIVLALAAAAAGCKSDNNKPDADEPDLSGGGLERPGALARPPSQGLPDDLRPPR